MSKNSMSLVGLDLGDRQSHLVVLDAVGERVEETRLPTPRAALKRRFAGLPPSRVAMEVGTHSHWTSHLLRGLGHEVLVANARKLLAERGGNNARKRAPTGTGLTIRAHQECGWK